MPSRSIHLGNPGVKVQASEDNGAVIFQTAEFDGLGRRIKKVVTKSGPHDGTVVYFYDGQKIIETRNGSGTMVQQFIHGTQYIDELVMMRAKDKGDLYVHQDANWNVIGLTDLGGRLVERNEYTPYGEPTMHQETGYGDRDGDGDVDSTDKGTPGTTCTGTVSGECRILDLDFDGDYDSTDATNFDALPQGYMLHPGRRFSSVDQPFAHQGLIHDAELGSYQNRHRQYLPSVRRFAQRDPVAFVNRQFGAMSHYGAGMNLYEYVRTNPLRVTDPRGLDPCTDLIGQCFGALRFTGCVLCGVISRAGPTANRLKNNWIRNTGETDWCKIDAMQHCLGSALAAWDCGADCALCLGYLLEIKQNDFDPMDLHNNKVGVKCAAPPRAPGRAVRCCEEKLNSGELKTDGDCQ